MSKSQAATYLSNHFLIAMPGMQDPNFLRGVTFVCQHTDEGAMGLVINRAADITLSDVLRQMRMSTQIDDVARAPVYIGGPVQPERGFVLHDAGERWDSSFAISDEIAITTSRDILQAMAEGRGPKRTMVALGYAGWSAGQLEAEMKDNAWLTARADSKLIFDTPLAQRWEAAARSVGIDPFLLSDHAGHA
jgi:putative transcriptional regulator